MFQRLDGLPATITARRRRRIGKTAQQHRRRNELHGLRERLNERKIAVVGSAGIGLACLQLPDESRQFILLPGPAQTHSFDGKPVEFDWQLNLSSGKRYRAIFKQQPAVLHVYVNLQKPRPLDAKMVEKWLDDLDSEVFKPRDKAMQELAKLGNDAKPFLRATLAGQLPEAHFALLFSYT